MFVNCNWVVTRWQYTFTHKQYIEQYKTNSTYNNTTILEECGPYPVLASITLAFALNRGKSTGKLNKIQLVELEPIPDCLCISDNHLFV